MPWSDAERGEVQAVILTGSTSTTILFYFQWMHVRNISDFLPLVGLDLTRVTK